PGGSIQVGFTTTTFGNAPNGMVIPFEVELYEDGELVGTLSRSVRVQSESQLQLAISALEGTSLRQQADPIEPGKAFSYQVVYGNPGPVVGFSASNAQLRLPLPDSVQFIGADGQGIYDVSEHSVSWSLEDSLLSGGGGSVSVDVKAKLNTPDGELLVVENAVLTGVVGQQERSAIASVVTRVGSKQVELSITDGLHQESGVFELSNSSGSASGLLTFFVLSPEGVSSLNPLSPPGGSCSSCGRGQLLSWGTNDLGNLFDGSSQSIDFLINSLPVRGRVLPLESTLLNDGGFDGSIELIRLVNPIGTVTEFDGLLQTTEFGGTDQFTIRLGSAPADDTSVTLSLATSDAGEGSVSPASLNFSDVNWDEPQTVTVTGVDDTIKDGSVSYKVVIQVSASGDINFAGLDPRDVIVINLDNDGDNDGDGLTNAQEAQLGTNPNLADTDGDGLPDGYEVDRRFAPLNPLDGEADADGDGFSNREEFDAQTDPRDASDIPAPPGLSPAILFRAFCTSNPSAPAC
ncbi:MAG: hypothetical protein AAGI72_15645, partial [Pseudomonadota bacterium]